MIEEHFLVSGTKNPSLRIGILLDDLTLPRCFERIIDQIQKSNFATIELLMIRAPERANLESPRRSKWKTLWNILIDPKRRKHLAFIIYNKLDQRFFSVPNHPQEQIDCTGKLLGIDSIEITPITSGFVHRFSSSEIEEIRKRDLDVILRFGFNILRGDILKAARFGVWSYHHGDNEFYRGGPAHFWELKERNKMSGVILQVLNEELDAGQVLEKALFSTEIGGVSLVRNRFTPHWGAVHFVIQKLYELHTYGWEHLERHSIPNKPYQGKRKIYRTPTNGELLRWLVPTLATKLGLRLTRVFSRKKLYDGESVFRQGVTLY